jgi:hypothetical protein
VRRREATVAEQQTDVRYVSIEGAVSGAHQLQRDLHALHNSLEAAMAPLNMRIKQATVRAR